MEKPNARPRRNAAQLENEAMQSNSDDILDSGDTETLTAATTRDGLAGGENRRRIATNGATLDKRVPQAIQEAFLDERNDVMSVINELEEQLDRHQEIRESMERELATANEKTQGTAQRIQELEWQVISLQTRVDAAEKLKADIQAFEEEIGDANARAARATDQVGELEKDRARLKNELKAATKQLEELWAVRKERDGLRTDAKNLGVKVAELDRTNRDLAEEKNTLSTKLQEATGLLDEERKERHQLIVSLRGSEDRVKELIRLQESLADKVEAVRGEKKSLQSQILHLERENTRLVEQRQFYETELTSLRNANRSTESALTSIKKAFAEVRIALTETKTRARRRTIDNWPRFSNGLRELDGDGVDSASLPLSEVDPRSTPATTTSARSAGTLSAGTID